MEQGGERERGGQNQPQQHAAEAIDFAKGHPGGELLPVELFQRASKLAFEELAHASDFTKKEVLSYCADENQAGFVPFREKLAEFINSHVHWEQSEEVNKLTRAAPEQLFVTTGASSAFSLACTYFAKPGDTVLVEDPTYYLAPHVFHTDHHMKLATVPTDHEGIDLNALERMLKPKEEGGEGVPPPSLLYIVPTFHNPKGVTLPHAKRRRLVELSKQHGFMVVADEVYQFLYFDEKDAPPPPLACYDLYYHPNQRPTVLSLHSFSKTLAPGLRLGWIHAHEAIVNKLAHCAVADSGGSFAPLPSMIVYKAIQEGLLERHLSDLRSTYQRLANLLYHRLLLHFPLSSSTSLAEEKVEPVLPNLFTIRKPKGGFFLWITLNKEYLEKNEATGRSLTGAGIAAACSRMEHLIVKDGATCTASSLMKEEEGGRAPSEESRHSIRLCWAYLPPELIEEGIRRFARAIQQLLNE
ncbi:PLP-dependent aminotransferase family protein [Balamuthia mandrillaris]